MTHPTGNPATPDPAERATRNAALLTDNIETGFFDDHGRPAPWPDDIDDWRPTSSEPTSHQPGEQLF